MNVSRAEVHADVLSINYHGQIYGELEAETDASPPLPPPTLYYKSN